MTRLVDLSQDIYQGMQVYPGHLKTVVFDHASHEETAPRFEGGFSFQTTGFLINDNGPTHVDSFSHLDPDPAALSIDRMPLELFYGLLCAWTSRTCRRGQTSPPSIWTPPKRLRRSRWSEGTSCCCTRAPMPVMREIGTT